MINKFNFQYKYDFLHLIRLLFLGLLLLASTHVNAEVIAEDSFEDYSVGNISGNNSGAGWSGAWSTGSSSEQAKVIDTSSSPLEYTDSNGNSISGGDRAIEITQNNDEVAKRSLSATYNNTEIYASMLIQFTGTQNGNDFLANWLGSQNTKKNPNFGIKMNLGSGGTDFFTRTKNGQEVYSTNIVNGQTYFLVMKVSKTGNTSSKYNRAQLWVNPTTLDTEPAASTGESKSNSSLKNFSTIGLRSINLDNDDSIIVDRIRYGTTWEDVATPDPKDNNLLKNGSFEIPAIGANNWKVSNTLESWSIDSSGIEIRNNIEGEAFEGDQFVELDANKNTSISQTITTNADQNYELSFAYSPRKSQPASTNNIQAYWNGVLLDDITDTGGSSHNWKTYTYVVKGTGSDNVTFTAAGTSDGYGGSLDNVALTTTNATVPDECEKSIPTDYAIYAHKKLTINNSLNINGNSIGYNVKSPQAAVGINGNITINTNLTLPALSPSSFPANSSSTNVVQSSNIILNNTSETFYKNITQNKNNKEISFTGGGTVHIDRLTSNANNTTINFAAGSYFINNLVMDGNNDVINITSSPVYLHIGQNFTLNSNNQKINQSGAVKDFIVYLHNSAKFTSSSNNSVLSGFIYGPEAGDIVINPNNMTINGGLVTGNGNITINSKPLKLNFSSADQTSVGSCNTNSACSAGNVSDNFSTQSFSNNDGSKTWASDWQEIGESNGVSSGKIRVNNSLCTSGSCLRLGTPSGNSASTYTNRGVKREVNLSNASAATLSFEYRVGVAQGSSTVTLAISNDGGSSWTDLKTYSITSSKFSATRESFNISQYAAANTQIRFLIDGNNEVTGMYIDNINIENTCSDGALDHFQLHYSSNGLTCLPSSLTLKACANNDCSSLYTQTVDITLAGTGTWSNNTISLTTGESSGLTFQASNSGDTTLSVSNSTVAAANAIKCYQDNVLDTECSIPFSEAGFVFDVPTQTACKTSADVTIRAVQLDTTTNQCTGALTGTQSVKFFSSYSSPSTGTKKVKVSGTEIDKATPGTPVNLNFNEDGEATFKATYDDAGEVKINASHTLTSGVELSGSDTFVSKPAALVVYSSDSSAACSSGDASCSPFKKAGESFDLKVKAACWEKDADTDFSNNAETPNFVLNNITAKHNLTEPSGGKTGTLGISEFNFTTSDKGLHSIEQSISEVGVFTFSVSPPSYFGESLNVASSDNIGRFYPDHFALISSGITPACNGYSYMDEPFSISYNIEAQNSADNKTENYQGSFVKTTGIDITAESAQSPTSNLSNRIQMLSYDSSNWSQGSYEIVNGSAIFSRLAGTIDGAYDNVNIGLKVIDSDGVVLNSTDMLSSDGSDASCGTNCLERKIGTSNIRYGRLAISNAHGSELAPLDLPISAQYFDGTNWTINSLDNCSTSGLAFDVHMKTSEPSHANTISLSSGESVLSFAAAGEDNTGYIDVSAQLTAKPWLQFDWNGDGTITNPTGRASFGLFKGSDNIIFRRELY